MMLRFLVVAAGLALAGAPALADAGWPVYGGDDGGMRYSPANQITPENVDNLIPIWTYHTGDIEKRDAKTMRRTKLEGTPILVGDKLLVCSPFNEVIALDPGTGQEKWRFDPKIPTDQVFPSNKFTCRGVAAWTDSSQFSSTALCSKRVIAATNDARVIALDLDTGKPCPGFGIEGEVKVQPSMQLKWPGEFQITSAPTVVGDVIIVGSSIGDNARVEAPHGTVHAFDVRSGQLKWTWDPVPRDASDPARATWGDGWQGVGHANVWAPMSADAARGLVFMPTSSASPDFFGGLRPGNNEHANSVVAVKADTGQLVWSFQIVHHDVWDYDTPTQPTLATLNLDEGKRDVVIQGTKQGFVFVLDRDTGKPIWPVEERPVPQGAVAGETLSPTQPFPTHVPVLVPQKITADEAFGMTPWDRSACHDLMAKARSEGLYTPPSEQGTIMFPFTGGGINWGGVTFDPVNQVLYANTNRAMHLITLFPAARYEALDAEFPDKEVSPQRGAPFGMIRETLIGPLGVPCNPPPWSMLAAIDLKAGKILWETPIGTTEEIAPLGLALPWGVPALGGSVATAGGVVFIGAAMDSYLRAFDAKTGAELWQGRLPTSAHATPMTYEWQGRQIVVVAAGGHGDLGNTKSDTFVAFALPKEGESGPSLLSRTYDRPGGRFIVNMALILISLTLIIWGIRRGWRALRGR